MPTAVAHFDMRDDEGITIDDEGLELSNLNRVQEEAARSLADMARDVVVMSDGKAAHDMAIHVRDDDGPVLQVRFTFEIDRLRKH